MRHVNAACYLGILERGSTGPLDFEADDGNRYVVKCGGRGLPDHFSELLATTLAPAFSVPTPTPAIVHFSPVLIEFLRQIGETGIADRLTGSGGSAFGSQWVKGAIELETLPRLDRHYPQIAQIATFDLYLGNPDRSYENPNLLQHRGQLLAIDQAQAFPWLYGYSFDDFSAVNRHISTYYNVRPAPIPTLSSEMVRASLDAVPRSWFQQMRLDYADAVDTMMERAELIQGLLAQRNLG